MQHPVLVRPITDLFGALTLLLPACQAGSGRSSGADCCLAIIPGEDPEIRVKSWGESVYHARPHRSESRWPVTADLARQLVAEELVERDGLEFFSRLSRKGHERWCALRDARRS